MPDMRVMKLTLKGLDAEDAQRLVDAGLTTPRLIKAAGDSAVSAAVGGGRLSAVRAKFPAREQ